MIEEALTEARGGVIVAMEAVPNSKGSGISWDPWRQRVKLKITAKAQKGKANEAIVSFFSVLAPSEIVAGARSREKRVFVAAPYEKVLAYIQSHLSCDIV